jgi:hypothetical protein
MAKMRVVRVSKPRGPLELVELVWCTDATVAWAAEVG